MLESVPSAVGVLSLGLGFGLRLSLRFRHLRRVGLGARGEAELNPVAHELLVGAAHLRQALGEAEELRALDAALAVDDQGFQHSGNGSKLFDVLLQFLTQFILVQLAFGPPFRDLGVEEHVSELLVRLLFG